MSHRVRPLSLVLGAALVCGPGAASPGEASLGYFFHNLFRPCCPPPSTVFYAPVSYGFGPSCCAPPVMFRPVSCCPSPCSPCGPCGPCSPCGPGGCPGGACDVSLAPTSPSGRPLPVPDTAPPPGNRPRTFIEDEPPAGDEGFLPRTREPMDPADGYDRGNAPGSFDRRDDADTFGGDTFGSGEGGNRESFRPESVIPDRKRPPATPAEEVETGSEVELRLPELNLDQKITWRERPQPTRLLLRPRFGFLTVARVKLDPNAGWTPASGQGVRLVSK